MCFYKYQLPWCQPLRVHFMWTLYFDDQSIGFLFSSLMLLLTSSEVRVGEESFFMVCCIWNTNTDFNKNFRSQRHVSLFSLWCLSVKPSIAATPPESHWIWLYIPCCCCCCCCIASVVSDSVQPHRRQPTRLPHPWDSPGKNTGVGCHCLLQCMKVQSLSRVQLLATPWTAAYQAPPSMGYSRQEHWSGVPYVIKRVSFFNS